MLTTESPTGDQSRPVAFIYDRRATPSEEPLQSRVRACRAYAEQAGWDVSGVWVDTGDHALSDHNRPQLDALKSELQAAAASGSTAVVLVFESSRLAHDPLARSAATHRVNLLGGQVRTVRPETGVYLLPPRFG